MGNRAFRTTAAFLERSGNVTVMYLASDLTRISGDCHLAVSNNMLIIERKIMSVAIVSDCGWIFSFVRSTFPKPTVAKILIFRRPRRILRT